jgi:hypothetical protein
MLVFVKSGDLYCGILLFDFGFIGCFLVLSNEATYLLKP